MAEVSSMNPSRLIISLDFECGWGSLESGRWRAREAAGIYTRLRQTLKTFLSDLDTMEIPLVWATVGAMVAEPGDRLFDHLPHDAQETRREFLREAKTDTCDGRDLLQQICSARVPHEIACHSFSHLRFTYPGFSTQAQREDVLRCCQILSRFTSSSPKSLVFPQNVCENFQSLEGTPVRIVRTVESPARAAALMQPIKRAANLLRPPPESSVSELSPGLFGSSPSLFFNWGISRTRWLRKRLVLQQAAQMLNQAIQGGKLFHFWLHPFNLVETRGLRSALIAFLRHVALQRELGRIQVLTLCELLPDAINSTQP